MTGSTIAQIIALAIYPILTDLYSPDDFGLFSLYMGIIAITGIISTGRYQLAILMPKTDKQAVQLSALGLFIAVSVSLILLMVVVLFRHGIAQTFNNPNIEKWLWFVPLSTFMIAFFQVSIYWHNRQKRFRTTAAANLSQSISNSAIKLSTSKNFLSGGGLITGAIIGQVIGAVYFLISWISRFRVMLGKVNLQGMKEEGVRYYRFPGFNLPNNLVNNLSNSLPIFLISAYFGSAELGLYSLGFTMIFRPMNLITNSMEQVFSQRVIKKFNDGVSIRRDVFTLMKRTVQIAILPFALVGVFGPLIFSKVFGAEWEMSGRFMQLLIPWFFVAFIANQLTFIPDLLSKQKTAFIINLVRLILRLVGMAVGIYLDNIMLTLGLFSLASFTMVVVTIIWYVRLIRQSVPRVNNDY